MANGPRCCELTAQSIFRQVDGAAKIMLASSKDSLEHLKSARIFFERGMVREAAEKATDAEVEALREVLRRQRGLLGDADGFIAADMEFHTTDRQDFRQPDLCCGRPRPMLGWLKEYHTEMLIWTGKEKFTLAEHENIIARIAAHDQAGAESEMIKHLERSRSLYVAQAN